MSIIIETTTEAAGLIKQQEIHEARVQRYRDEGYPVIRQEDGSDWVYPKNMSTGEPNMDAMPTKLWAEPAVTPDSTFEIPVPTDVAPVFTGNSEWDYVQRPRPPEWSDWGMMETEVKPIIVGY